MKIIRVSDLENTSRDVTVTGCSSIRMLIDSDEMGFGFNKTSIPKGEPQHWHYPNHLEACYCISGRAELINLTTKRKYEITPETLYVLDKHDNHTFQALEDTILVSVFNPPLAGNEKHDENGFYPKSEWKKRKAKTIIEMIQKSEDNYEAYEKLMELL